MIRNYNLPFTEHSSEDSSRKLVKTRIAERLSSLEPGEGTDLGQLISDIEAAFEQFLADTTQTLHWDRVPDEKKIRDWKYTTIVLASSYNFDTDMGSDEEVLAQIPKPGYPPKRREPRNFGGGLSALLAMRDDPIDNYMPPQTHKGSYAFVHALDAAVSFLEQEQCTQLQAAGFIRELLRGANQSALYSALYTTEMLNNPARLGWQSGSNVVLLARAMNSNYAERKDAQRTTQGSLHSIDNEEQHAEEFIRTRQKELKLPRRFAVHSCDGQLGWRGWRTYDEIRQRTAANLASIAMYGLVAGGVAGWDIAPERLWGTVDYADLCIMNYDTRHQGAVLAPLEAYVRPDCVVEFNPGLAVMIDGQKEGGVDIIIRPPNLAILPSVQPQELVIIVPTTLHDTVERHISNKAYLTGRSDEETQATMQRGIQYDSTLWGNFHTFNEWLQTTEQGKSLLEERLGRPVEGFKRMEDIQPEACNWYLS